MRIVRGALLLAGVGLLYYGVTLLLKQDPADLRSVAFWFAGGILLHDGVFAPLCAAAGLAARQFLPRAWWAPLACGAVCTVTLVLLAVPVIGREHAMPNPTVLDRPYLWGLIAALTVVWAIAGLDLLRRRSARPRLRRAPSSVRR